MPVTWIETRDLTVTTLTPFPGNPRRGDIAAIRESVRRNGQYRALVVRRHGGRHTILAGNHTAEALAAEGYEAARCEVITCTDDEAARINLADNRLSDIATDDPDALAELLSSLDGDLEGTGWTTEDVKFLVSGPPDLDDLAGELGEPAAGDLWPVLRFRVPPDLRDDFYDLTAACDTPGDDSARFAYMIIRLRLLA